VIARCGAEVQTTKVAERSAVFFVPTRVGREENAGVGWRPHPFRMSAVGAFRRCVAKLATSAHRGNADLATGIADQYADGSGESVGFSKARFIALLIGISQVDPLCRDWLGEPLGVERRKLGTLLWLGAKRSMCLS
jgi:hypothetical protein